MSSSDFARPFGSEAERNEEHATLKALASHLAGLESMAAEPATSWSAEDLDAFPPVPGAEGASPPERLARWASDHARDLGEVRHLAASPSLADADVRRGIALAEGALAAMLGISAEEADRRLRSDAGKGLRTPTSPDLPPVASPPASHQADRETGSTVIVRPRPDDREQRVRDKGANKGWIERRIDPSDSWWRAGALIVDDQGPALIDADGVRHPFPEAARGGYLVRATLTFMGGGGGRPITDLMLFVADQGKQVLLRLPDEGFGEAEVDQGELDAFARAAGLTYLEPDLTYAKGTEFPGLRDAPSLEGAIHDQATRDRLQHGRLNRMGDRLRHPFGNRDGG